MKIGVLGSGIVGQTVGAKLVGLGHEVSIGTRDPQKLAEWAKTVKGSVKIGSFAEAASSGELIFLATNGVGTLNALELAGKSNFDGKVVIDISNPLDFSKGFPPSLTVCNTDSLGEQVQRALPNAKIVKSLNTVTAALMVDASLLPGEHVIYVAGNDADAKKQVTDILKNWFKWQAVVDVGDITGARATEMILPIWVRLYGALQTGLFNFQIVK
ncbi:MAG: NAD(P)-binding domain-containing protein [Anaerolineae bacterium]|nr:NAD(P)-binding domain-containing protein [Anaerolineae bacterium]